MTGPQAAAGACSLETQSSPGPASGCAHGVQLPTELGGAEMGRGSLGGQRKGRWGRRQVCFKGVYVTGAPSFPVCQ